MISPIQMYVYYIMVAISFVILFLMDNKEITYLSIYSALAMLVLHESALKRFIKEGIGAVITQVISGYVTAAVLIAIFITLNK